MRLLKKKSDIFDSCLVLSQHESEILNNFDPRLSFLLARHLNFTYLFMGMVDVYWMPCTEYHIFGSEKNQNSEQACDQTGHISCN